MLGNTLVASLTNFTVWFAVTFFVFLETQSVFATSMIAGFYLAFTALSGIWFGSIVDHTRKKTAMVMSSAVSLTAYILAGGLYLSVPAETFKDITNPALWVFVFFLMIGVLVGNIRNIALPTLVTILIPADRRDKANGLIGSTSGIAFMLTSVISGLLVGMAGMQYVLLMAVILTIASITHLLFIHVEEKEIVQVNDGQTSRIDLRGTWKTVVAIPGLVALIFFTTFNNFLGGVFMSLLDAYGLSLVSVETWGLLFGFLSIGFIAGGLAIAKWGLGKNPLRALFLANIVIWTISSLFTVYSSIVVLTAGMFIYLCVVPYIEAAEHTIIQKVVPQERQGRVFGFAQSVEMAASPLTAFIIGPIAQFIFIPFMTTGRGVELIGDWFGTGMDRGIALVFVLTGLIGLTVTLLAFYSKYYRMLSDYYLSTKPAAAAAQPPAGAQLNGG